MVEVNQMFLKCTIYCHSAIVPYCCTPIYCHSAIVPCCYEEPLKLWAFSRTVFSCEHFHHDFFRVVSIFQTCEHFPELSGSVGESGQVRMCHFQVADKRIWGITHAFRSCVFANLHLYFSKSALQERKFAEVKICWIGDLLNCGFGKVQICCSFSWYRYETIFASNYLIGVLPITNT